MISNKIFLEIGEISTINGTKIQCVRGKNPGDCQNECFFKNKNCLEMECTKFSRHDGNYVYFIKIN